MSSNNNNNNNKNNDNHTANRAHNIKSNDTKPTNSNFQPNSNFQKVASSNLSLKDSSIIPRHGGYRNLLTYKRSEIIYDATVYFTKRYLSKFDRTVDQMVQAARSGKQNIVEASMASGTSKESEIKLTNVARASLEELLVDYRDYLRINRLSEWDQHHPYNDRMKELIRNCPPEYETFRKGIEHESAEISANVMINLIKVTTYLLMRQLQRLEKDFLEYGGLKERMYRARVNARERKG